jgi:hypothetical protein
MLSNEMPLNQTIVVAQTNVFRSTATRISAEIVELAYYHQATNDLVLKVLARVDGTSSVVDLIDPIFWSITINGRPATAADLDDIRQKSMLGFNVNGSERLLDIRLPT